MGCIIKGLKEAIKSNKRIERSLKDFLSTLDSIEKEASKDVYMISGKSALNPGNPITEGEFSYRGKNYKSLKAAIDKSVDRKSNLEQQEKTIKKVLLAFYKSMPLMRAELEGSANGKFMVLEDDKWTYTNLYTSAINDMSAYFSKQDKEDTKKEDGTIPVLDMNKKAEDNAEKLKKQCSNKGGK